MKILFVCNTPFQIITALNIWQFKYQNDICDIVLSDCFNNYATLAENLKQMGLFRNVETVYIKDKLKSGIKNVMRSIFSPKALTSDFLLLRQWEYDVFLFFNFDIFTCSIYQKMAECNPSLQVYRFDEGYSTYFNNLAQEKNYTIFEKLEAWRHHKYLSASISGYWYYHPDLARYKHNSNDHLLTIPLLSRENKKLLDILNHIFEISDLSDQYTRRNIFFEDCSATDGNLIDDVELVKSLADYVGVENIEIKLHPRNINDRFKEKGLKTDQSGLPWEIILMNKDFTGYRFYTVASGSVLASKLYLKDDVKIYFLYKCINKRSKLITKDFEQYLQRMKGKLGGENIFVPENLEIFLKLIQS